MCIRSSLLRFSCRGVSLEREGRWSLRVAFLLVAEVGWRAATGSGAAGGLLTIVQAVGGAT